MGRMPEGVTTGRAVARADKNRGVFRDVLQRHAQEIQAALPRVGLTPERLIRVALTECLRNEKLLECSPASMIRAIITAAQLGLTPDGALGLVYLVPYKGEVSFQLGRDGLRTLVERSGLVRQVQCHSVYEGEHFHYQEGSDPKIEHTPDPWGARKRVKVPYLDNARAFGPATHEGDGAAFLGVYAVAWMREHDYPVCEVLSFNDIERLRQASKVPSSPAWRNWYERVSETKGLRQLCIHRLPKSTEDPDLRKARIAAEFDALADAGKPQPRLDLDPEMSDALDRMDQDAPKSLPAPTALDRSVAAKLAAVQGAPTRADETLFPDAPQEKPVVADDEGLRPDDIPMEPWPDPDKDGRD